MIPFHKTSHCSGFAGFSQINLTLVYLIVLMYRVSIYDVHKAGSCSSIVCMFSHSIARHVSTTECLGFFSVQVQHALKKSDSALITLNQAIAADPKNPLCKFHRASILFANDRHKVSRRCCIFGSLAFSS